MSTATATDALLTLSATVCKTYEGEAPTGTPAPYAVLHGGVGLPEGRMLDALTPHRDMPHRLIAVSNNKRGCRILANRLTDTIDGAHHDGATWEVRYVSDPLRDTQDGSTDWWTSTLEIHHHTTRS